MNLRNTTVNQDRVLEAEFRALRQLDFGTDALESIFEDLDNALTSANSNAEDASSFADQRIRDLETRNAELERDLAEARELLCSAREPQHD